jgi:hypothetical protein
VDQDTASGKYKVEDSHGDTFEIACDQAVFVNQESLSKCCYAFRLSPARSNPRRRS